MKTNKKVSLKERVFNLIGIVILIILTFYIMAVVLMRQMIQDNIHIQNEALLRIISDQIQDTVETPVGYISNINELITDQYPMEGAVVTDYLETIQKSYSYVSEIHIVSKDGRIINTAPYDDSLIGDSVVFEPYYKKGLIGEDCWSEVYINSNTGEPSISLSITEEDYLIIMDFDLSALPIMLNEGLFEQVRHIFILDQWGTYVVADDYQKVEARLRYEHFDELEMKDLGTKDGISDQYNVGYKKIEGLNWYIVFEFDNVKNYQKLNAFTIALLALWGIMAIFVYLFLRRYFSDVNGELRILQERAFSFLHNDANPRENNLDQNVDMKFIEISNLNDDFNLMMRIIQERQTEIMMINTNLERTVLERTKDLEEINAQLEEEIQEKECAEEEIRNINESLDQQVKIRTEELEFLNGVLQKSVQLAEQANEDKSKFLSIMSHEMRTPLNGIQGFLQILRTTKLDQEQVEIVSFMDGSTKMLLELINDLLEVEKYSVGKMIFEEETLNLKNILEDSVKQHQALIRNKGLDFVLANSNDPDIYVEVDRMKLQQLVGNLLSNALKFTSRGGIRVSFYVEAGVNKINLHMSISDTGIGIKEEVRQYLFTPFTQADGKIAKEFGGTGLGLTICKEIVSHYGGEIYFESNYGVGTTFFANLLLQKAVKISKNVSQKSMSNTKRRNIIRQYKSVLVAEDNITNQKLMSMYLQKLNIDYVIANNGKEAIEMLRNQDFDLILMDCQMPIMDGFEATRRIRKEFGDSVKIIAMTAYTSKEVQEQCKELGMDEYLSKPIELDKLANIIGTKLKLQDMKKVTEPVDYNERIDEETKLLMQKLPFDYDTCKELVETYIKQMQEGLRVINEMIDQKDFLSMAKKVHELKGASGAARQDAIMKKFEKIEELLVDQRLEDVTGCLKEIKTDQLFKI